MAKVKGYTHRRYGDKDVEVYEGHEVQEGRDGRDSGEGREGREAHEGEGDDVRENADDEAG
jgi:hypothetical protein